MLRATGSEPDPARRRALLDQFLERVAPSNPTFPIAEMGTFFGVGKGIKFRPVPACIDIGINTNYAEPAD